MRGLIFTLEAVVTLIAIAAIAGSFVFVKNVPDTFIQYNLMASDVADLAVARQFWEKPIYQPDRVDAWSLKLGLCVKLKRGDQLVKSYTCGKAGESHVITADHVYFDQSSGQMNAFTVFISPPG